MQVPGKVETYTLIQIVDDLSPYIFSSQESVVAISIGGMIIGVENGGKGAPLPSHRTTLFVVLVAPRHDFGFRYEGFLRPPRADIDHSSPCVVAIKDTPRPPDDFNPFHLVKGNLSPIASAEIDFVYPSSVHQYKSVERACFHKAPDVQRHIFS